MSDIAKYQDISIDSYVAENRNKLDEALVSLRMMKVVDDYLVNHKISKRDFAKTIECSESYVSQMMSGTKKFNVSFINKFEKAYNVEIGFQLINKEFTRLIEDNLTKIFLSFSSDSSIKLDSEIIDLVDNKGVYTVEQDSNEYLRVTI